MNTQFLNFTTFDLQLWPPPSKIESRLSTNYSLKPSLFAPLLLVYHAVVCIALQIRTIRDFEGRRDTVWYRFCLGHLFFIECFMLYVIFIYQKHCSLSDHIGLVLYASCGFVIQYIGA